MSREALKEETMSGTSFEVMNALLTALRLDVEEMVHIDVRD